MVMLLCVFFPTLQFAAMKSAIICVFVTVANFLGLKFPSITLHRAGLVVKNLVLL